MVLFESLLAQMLVLFAFIAIGYVLTKCKILPDNSNVVLSKLETWVFVPALVMGTLVKNCTPDQLGSLWRIMVFSIALIIVTLPLSFLCAKACCKDDFERKTVLYGLVIPNFGFVGNAIMKAVFPDLFFSYTIFTMPFFILTYAWGIPVLLIGDQKEGRKPSLLKNFLNPMFGALLIGLVISLTGLRLPTAVVGAVDLLGDCMSPVAMILTGATIALLDLKKILRNGKIYLLSAIRLAVFPLLYILAIVFLPRGNFVTDAMLFCGMCIVSLPMGLNSVVIPVGYGKDTSFAAGLAIVTHTLSVITIPLAFLLFETVVL